MREFTCIRFIREETEQTSSLWTGVTQSDSEVDPLFIIAESLHGNRETEILLTEGQARELFNNLRNLLGEIQS